MKIAVFWVVAPCSLVEFTNVSEVLAASIIRAIAPHSIVSVIKLGSQWVGNSARVGEANRSFVSKTSWKGYFRILGVEARIILKCILGIGLWRCELDLTGL
jgi:hypothetical protein